MPRSTLLSIITINKNNAEGLSRSLASFREARSNSLVEFIFKDALSADNSIDIAKDFYDARNIHVNADAGIYDGMNQGALAASGKFLLWINSGDLLIPKNLDEALHVLKNSSKDIESFSCEVGCLGLDLIKTWSPRSTDLPFFTLPHPSTAIARETFLNLGMYSLGYSIAGDRDFFVRALMLKSSISCNYLTLSAHYEGGISGSRLLALENIRIDRTHKLWSSKQIMARRIIFWFGSIRRRLLGRQISEN